jgi:hopanoid biosynthesis associated RND transporter like protein HpnN
MSKSPIVLLVNVSTRIAWGVIAVAIALAAYCAAYSVEHFSVATDVRDLFPTNLPWTERALQFMAAFPQYEILVVVDAPTPELVERATTKLTAALNADRGHIRATEDPQGGAFFARNGLLFVPTDQLTRTSIDMQKAAPLVGALAADPSLRGILNSLSLALAGVTKGAYRLDALERPMSAAADTVNDALTGRPAHFSWRSLAGGERSAVQHRFIEVEPVLDFKALQPGRGATDAITDAARRLNLSGIDQARIRLTGIVPMNDAQFATLKENAGLNGAVSLGAVLLILWLALRSWRIILAAAISVTCGLSYSAALGLYLVRSLNLISVAFFVLFIGLAVDFGIQFCVRYRAERHETGNLRAALVGAARKAGGPLALAGAATALGFSAFLPTNYRGLSELGEIAGPGMIIAFLTSVTLLPALLQVLKPPDEPRTMGFAALAPIDRFLRRWRVPVLVITLGSALLASPLLLSLRFDFNALHLQDPNSEPVATFLELRKDPAAGANAVEIVAPNLQVAQADALRLSTLPQVAGTRTLASFVPTDQAAKLKKIGEIAQAIGPQLELGPIRPPPTDAEDIDSLQSTAQELSSFATVRGAGADAARRLSALLARLASADPATRRRAATAFVESLKISLDDLQQALKAAPVTIATVPAGLKREWLAPDGRARVQLLPKGDSDDTASLRSFVQAVLDREPTATGPAVILYQAGNTIVLAFIEAGLFAVAAIALLLWVALRRVSDVLMTLIPLLLAMVFTLELCVVFDLPLNFANIIALPLLLGVGVAFKIYYTMAWRRGHTDLVQSTLTRAVMFSAMTTAVAFGSLWLSHHPGTSSMGKLMSLALVCTMMAAVLFQPALMGPPREMAHDKQGREPSRDESRS